jgi:2-dehydro-3-deoxyphosphogluconate aldolase/(4S)-4-hydroxy-2-oxoglutarate aldolase
VPAIPGATTPTEIGTASRLGVRLVKFFPAEPMGGVELLKALAAPFGDVLFVPTGGINPTNLVAYLSLSQVAACGGTWIAPRALLAERRFDEVERLAREAVEIVRELRNA